MLIREKVGITVWFFFGVFLNNGPFLGPSFGTVAKNAKHKKLRPVLI